MTIYFVPAMDFEDSLSIAGQLTASGYSVDEGDTVTLTFADYSIDGSVTASDYSVNEGDTVTLEFTPVANTYQWIDANGDDIVGETGLTYDWIADGNGQPRIRVTNPITGKSRIFRAPTIAVDTTPPPLTPNPGLAFADLSGARPSILDSDWYTWETSHFNQRLANVPSARTKSYYFSNAGDDGNVGTIASPKKTIQHAAKILSPSSGTLTAGATLTAASPIYLNGKSWWMGGWYSASAGSNYGPLLQVSGQYALLTCIAGTGHPGFYKWTVNGEGPVLDWGVVVGDGPAWAYVEAWYDHTTLLVSMAVNGGTPITYTLDAQLSASAGALEAGAANGGATYHIGNLARLFILPDYLPSSGDRATMYNSGKGLRNYTLPQDLLDAFNTNNGSFWNLNAVEGQSTFTDGISGNTFTSSGAQNPVIPPGPDEDDPIAIVGGAVTGGADITIYFNRGETPFYGPLRSNRNYVSIDAYGTGNDPVFSLYTVTIPNVWTAVDSHYKVACDPVGVVHMVGDDYYPLVRKMHKAEDAAEVDTTNNSFFYDTVGGELHLNVGGDPAVVSPDGWEGTVRLDTAEITAGYDYHYVTKGRFFSLRNVVLQGSGITEPGNSAGYGFFIEINQTADAYVAEAVFENVQFLNGGYHLLGIFGTNLAATVSNCTFDQMMTRNQPQPAAPVPGDCEFIVCFGDQQEYVEHNCTFGGMYSSWDLASNLGTASLVIHGGGGGELPTLVVKRAATYDATTKPLANSCLVGMADPLGDWSAVTAYEVDAVVDWDTYDTGFGISSGMACVNLHCRDPFLGASQGYLIGLLATQFWLLNVTATFDGQNVSGPMRFIRQMQVGGKVYAIGCRFGMKNIFDSGTFVDGTNGEISGEFKNSIVTMEGAGLDLGVLDSSSYDHCAFYGVAGEGTSPVNLASIPSLTARPSTSSQLYNAGATGLVEYDEAKRTRLATPTIGPMEAQ